MKIADTKKLIKQLIKKYHPDLYQNDNRENTNNDIAYKLTSILNDLKIQINKTAQNTAGKTNEPKDPLKKNSLVLSPNQDYLYYKLGIKYYRNIHPNFIYKRKSDSTYELKSSDELAASLNNIILSIYLSEHYFTKVILEYPESIWRNDAIAKIKLLLKLTKSYENIDPNERKVVDSSGFVKEMGIKISKS